MSSLLQPVDNGLGLVNDVSVNAIAHKVLDYADSVGPLAVIGYWLEIVVVDSAVMSVLSSQDIRDKFGILDGSS